MLPDFVHRLRALFKRRAVERELDEELRFHVDRQVEQYERLGLPRAEAVRRARLALGGLDQAKEEYRDALGVRLFDDLRRDVAVSIRSLFASRGIALAAVATLALGTGANTAVLAVAYGVLLRPLPFAAPDRLVVIGTASRVGSAGSEGILRADIDEWRRRLPDIDGVAAFAIADLTVRGMSEPTVVHSVLVTGAFFSVLGTPPAIGTPFSESDASTVVLADRYAHRVGSAPELLGRDVTIGGVPFQVAAVMPPAFAFPDDETEIWVPSESIGDLVIFGNADSRTYRLIARLRPGVPIERLRQEADSALHQIHPDKTQVIATVEPLLDVITGDSRLVLAVFVAAAALLLLVACANVAMLLIARAQERRRELAVRLALGASAARLVRSAFVEISVLAGAGSTLGVLLAYACLRLFSRVAGSSLPRVSAVALDWPVLAATLVVAVFVALASGVAPALVAARADFPDAFRQTSWSPAAVQLRSLLVVLQVAVAIVLLAGGGLFGRTVIGLLRGHGGVAPDHVVTSRIVLTEGTRFDAQGRSAFLETLLEHVRGLPGVLAAGIGSSLPPRRSQLAMQIPLSGATSAPGRPALTDLVAVTPGYLEVLGVRLEQGRFFDEHDAQSGAPVTILSEGAAHDFYGQRTAIDRNFFVALPAASGGRARPRIVGVVSDVRYTGLDTSARGSLYLLWPSLPASVCYLVARTAGDPSTLEAALPRTVHDLDPGLPILDVRSLDDEMNLAIAGRELRLWLVAAFAGLAFAVALVGLSATLARTVGERRRELAIRSALGAKPQDVMALVGIRAATLVATGLTIGLATAAASGRWVASLLSGVSPYDPTTYVTVIAITLVAAALVCYVPAHRASKVDPLEILRSE